MNSNIYKEIENFVKNYDLNKDGKVTPQEIYYSFLKKMNGNSIEASKATGVLCATIDMNKDGKFSYQEIAKYCSDNAKKLIEQNSETAALADVEAMLLTFDKDKDRKLSKTEFVEYFKGQGGYTPYSDRDYVLKIIDLDKDGCVSASELQEWFKRRRINMASDFNSYIQSILGIQVPKTLANFKKTIETPSIHRVIGYLKRFINLKEGFGANPDSSTGELLGLLAKDCVYQIETYSIYTVSRYVFLASILSMGLYFNILRYTESEDYDSPKDFLDPSLYSNNDKSKYLITDYGVYGISTVPSYFKFETSIEPQMLARDHCYPSHSSIFLPANTWIEFKAIGTTQASVDIIFDPTATKKLIGTLTLDKCGKNEKTNYNQYFTKFFSANKCITKEQSGVEYFPISVGHARINFDFKLPLDNR
ncbi:hypothetical protein ACTFIZ_011703 [Dictyostelium cf. discoideum]